MGDEVLTLKTSGGRLWEIVHEPIAHAVAQLDGGPYELRLGGGTTLAARWEHRDSYDIDLTVEDGAGLRDLGDPENPFRRKMRAAGGRPEYLSRQWKITFPTGEVDLTEMNHVPPGRNTGGSSVESRSPLLSNAQILHGKLERADASPVRDVFDFIKARDLDPQALSAAVNCGYRKSRSPEPRGTRAGTDSGPPRRPLRRVSEASLRDHDVARLYLKTRRTRSAGRRPCCDAPTGTDTGGLTRTTRQSTHIRLCIFPTHVHHRTCPRSGPCPSLLVSDGVDRLQPGRLRRRIDAETRAPRRPRRRRRAQRP